MNYNIQSITDTKNSFPKNTRFVFEDFLIACPFSLDELDKCHANEMLCNGDIFFYWLAIENMHNKQSRRDHGNS
jgi:hypothetical protein